MRSLIPKYGIPTSALVLFGPLAGWLVAGIPSPDGGTDSTLLVTTSPVMGVIRGVVAVVLCAIPGLLGARMLGLRQGLTAAGLAMAWPAMRCGSLDGLLRTHVGLASGGNGGAGGVMVMLAIEGALLGVMGLVIATAIRVMSRDVEPERQMGFVETLVASAKSSGGLALLGAVVAGGVGAWAVAQYPGEGQVLAAGVVAGVAAAAAGKLVDEKAPLTTFVLAVGVLAVLGPISAMVVDGSSKILAGANRGTLFSLANPLPLHWLAGAFLGVPLGASWVGGTAIRAESM